MSARYSGDAFRERFGPWAVIAGGSDGIGAAYAHEAARRGLDVVTVARRSGPLETLARELESRHGVEARAVEADLTADDIVPTLAAATDGLDVGLFVYNAGSNRHAARFLDQPADHAAFLVALSCRAPALLAHHFGARMRERGRGGIVLMSSLASLAGSAYHAAYAATKAFDTALAEGLWFECAGDGIDVLGVLAGATRTETMLEQHHERFDDAMDPQQVARAALDDLGKGPICVPGAENRAAARGLWPLPRVGVINGMSQASAALMDLAYAPVDGHEFDAD